MRVVQIFNRYRGRINGEETVLRIALSALRQHGVEVEQIVADSAAIDQSFVAKAVAGLLGAYNPASYRQTARRIGSFAPEVAHAHNLFPLLSPSVLAACKNAGVACVVTAHSYALSCPVGTHLKDSQICLQCTGGRHHRCLTNNCRSDWIESAVFAVRSALIHQFGLMSRNISVLHVLTEFAKRHFVREGFPEERVVVLPNAVDIPTVPLDPSAGQYIAFAGRLNHVKGLDLVLEASRTAGLPVAIAGDASNLRLKPGSIPKSVRFVGALQADQMIQFYRGARFLVFPSRLFEMCPMVILEAMSHGLPIVCSEIGGLGEIVEDGHNGLLIPVNDVEALAAAMIRLWYSRSLLCEMGENSRRLAQARYDSSRYAKGLMALYGRAMTLGYPA